MARLKVLVLLTVCLVTVSSIHHDFTKRDAPQGGHGSSYSSYQDPGTGYGGYQESGYGYPPMEEEKEEPAEPKKCVVQKLLPTLILVDIFLGIIAGVVVGLVPPLKFPNQWNAFLDTIFAAPNVPLVVAAGGLGRDNEQMADMVARAIHSDECFPRLMCEGGKYAEGKPAMLIALDVMTPSHMAGNMRVFQESALRHTDCRTFACPLLDGTVEPSTLTAWLSSASGFLQNFGNMTNDI